MSEGLLESVGDSQWSLVRFKIVGLWGDQNENAEFVRHNGMDQIVLCCDKAKQSNRMPNL